MIGKLVKFKMPGLNVPHTVAGTVTRILPADSTLEVRLQQGGYVVIKVKEIIGPC
jgi:hypothetical protein